MKKRIVVGIAADEWEPLAPLIKWIETLDDVQLAGRWDQKSLPDNLTGNDAVFMFIHKTLRPDVEKRLVDYTRAGGRMIILHHGIASSKRRNRAWLGMAGIRIPPRDHPETPWHVLAPVTHTLVVLNSGHYITNNGLDYKEQAEYRSPDRPDLSGSFPAVSLPETEVFVNQQFTGNEGRTVLCGIRTVDPRKRRVVMQDRGAWVKPAGRGWVIYFQPGHKGEDYENPLYLQMLHNSLTWRPEAK